jgi:plastocyanin
MAVYDIISVPDYNNIQNIISNVLGTGSGNQGYGQKLSAPLPVALGDSVSKTAWDNLRFDIVNAYVHQNGALPAIKTVNEGDIIVYGAAEPNYQYLTLATQVATNKFDIAAGQYAIEPGTTVTYSNDWSDSFTSTSTLTFVNANAARYFFNSGGRVRFTSSFTPASSTPQNNSWQSTLSTAGTTIFAGNAPAVNFYTLTSTDQKFFSVSASGTYAANKWELFARCDIGNNSLGGATSITFTSVWTDGYVDPDVLAGMPATLNPYDGVVRGTLQLAITHLRAVGALFPDLIASSYYVPPPAYGNSAVYVFTPSATSISEGTTVTFTVSGVNIVNGTYNYSIVGTGIDASDFVDGIVNGTVTVVGNSGSFSKTLVAGDTVEGPQQFVANLYAGGVIVATTQTITVTDTNTYSAAGNYTFVVPLGVTTIKITAIGGGGGGAGTFGSSGGGGGGSGGYQNAVVKTVTPGETLSIVVGAAGGGGLYNGTPAQGAGGNGFASTVTGSFGTVTATGGGYGVYGTTNLPSTAGTPNGGAGTAGSGATGGTGGTNGTGYGSGGNGGSSSNGFSGSIGRVVITV